MADIHVEKKQGANVWPWVLGLIVLALLVWAAMRMMGGDGRNDRALYQDTTGVPPAAETYDTTAAPAFGRDTIGTGVNGIAPSDTIGTTPPRY